MSDGLAERPGARRADLRAAVVVREPRRAGRAGRRRRGNARAARARRAPRGRAASARSRLRCCCSCRPASARSWRSAASSSRSRCSRPARCSCARRRGRRRTASGCSSRCSPCGATCTAPCSRARRSRARISCSSAGAQRPLESVAVAVASALALCANPALWNTPAYVLGVLHNEAARQAIGLWAPLSPSDWLDVVFVLAAVPLVAGALRSRPKLWEIVALAGLALLTIHAARGGMWLALFAVPLAATGFGGRGALGPPAAPRAAGRARARRGGADRRRPRPAPERRHAAHAGAHACGRTRHAGARRGSDGGAGGGCRRPRLGLESDRRLPAVRPAALRRSGCRACPPATPRSRMPRAPSSCGWTARPIAACAATADFRRVDSDPRAVLYERVAP